MVRNFKIFFIKTALFMIIKKIKAGDVMSFNKSIISGKEHRKPWIGKNKSKNIDHSCRNHGSCIYCKNNRLYQRLKTDMKTENALKDIEFI